MQKSNSLNTENGDGNGTYQCEADFLSFCVVSENTMTVRNFPKSCDTEQDK